MMQSQAKKSHSVVAMMHNSGHGFLLTLADFNDAAVKDFNKLIRDKRLKKIFHNSYGEIEKNGIRTIRYDVRSANTTSAARHLALVRQFCSSKNIPLSKIEMPIMDHGVND